jgi:AcrR family transcriptional regulator
MRDTKQLILEAAAELFATRGFHGTTTKAIAKKAKVAEVSIFNHFRTKRRLYREVLQREVGSLVAQSFSVNPDSPEQLIDQLVEARRQNPRALRLFVYAVLEDISELQLVLREWRRTHLDRLCAIMDEQKARGQMAADVPLRPAAVALTALCVYVAQFVDVYSAGEKPYTSARKLVDFYHRLWSHGVSKKAPKN